MLDGELIGGNDVLCVRTHRHLRPGLKIDAAIVDDQRLVVNLDRPPGANLPASWPRRLLNVCLGNHVCMEKRLSYVSGPITFRFPTTQQ